MAYGLLNPLTNVMCGSFSTIDVLAESIDDGIVALNNGQGYVAQQPLYGQFVTTPDHTSRYALFGIKGNLLTSYTDHGIFTYVLAKLNDEV